MTALSNEFFEPTALPYREPTIPELPSKEGGGYRGSVGPVSPVGSPGPMEQRYSVNSVGTVSSMGAGRGSGYWGGDGRYYQPPIEEYARPEAEMYGELLLEGG